MSGVFAAGWTRRCVVALAVLSTVVSVRADDDSTPQSLLPPETYLFISCPSMTDLKTRFGEGAMGKLWNDRSMSAFRDEVSTQLDKASSSTQEEIGIPLRDLLNLPTGEVTLAASKVKNRLGLALIIDVGENTDTLNKVMSKIHEKLLERGTKTTETYEEVELTILKPADAKQGEFVTFTDESYAVFASSADLAKAILDRWDGKHEKTFESNASLKTILEECEESDDEFSDLYYYVDPVNLILEGLKLNPQTAGNAAMAQGFLPLLGLDKLKAIGGAVSLESDDFDSVSRTMFLVDQPAAGLLNIFRMPATLEGPPAWVARNVDQYSAFTWDVPGAYKAIDALVMTFAPQMGGLDALLDQAANHPNNPGIHPKKDLLDQLTGVTHVIATEDTGADDAAQRMLIAIGVKNEQTVQNVIEKVSAQAPNLKPRTFEGVTIYDMEGGGATSPALAVTRGHLFFATHPAALESAIRGKSVVEDPLSGADDYKAVAAHFPKPASSIGFARPAAQIKSIWEMARSGNFNDQLDGFDLTKLPEFSAVQKYFSPSGSYIAPHEKGAIMVNFSMPVE